jgi:predicted esterase
MHALLLAAALATGTFVENIPTSTDATQTYTLYLPSTYDTKKTWPLLLVFDPRGRGTSAAEIFRPAAEEYGWMLISSNQTRSDDEDAPNDRAVRALMAEAAVYSVNVKRIYATGFSGTAMVAWDLGIRTKMLAGVIGVGGRLVESVPPAKFNFAQYGFSGERDFNNREMRLIDDMLEGVVPHRFQSFDGEHRWITPELAREAIGWFEVVAGNQAVRARVLTEDVAAAEKLTGLAAWRRWQAIHRTYGGYEDRLAKLDVARELADEKKWDEWAAHYVQRLASAPSAIRAMDHPMPADAIRLLGLKDLQKRAERPGAEGATAKRLLTMVFAQVAFRLPPRFSERGEHAAAAAFLGVAAEMKPERADLWQELADIYERAGNKKAAEAALQRAKEARLASGSQ